MAKSPDIRNDFLKREIGNRNVIIEERFLKKHYKELPRTMLRYAIEKFPEKKRRAYLKGSVRADNR